PSGTASARVTCDRRFRQVERGQARRARAAARSAAIASTARNGTSERFVPRPNGRYDKKKIAHRYQPPIRCSRRQRLGPSHAAVTSNEVAVMAARKTDASPPK